MERGLIGHIRKDAAQDDQLPVAFVVVFGRSSVFSLTWARGFMSRKLYPVIKIMML